MSRSRHLGKVHWAEYNDKELWKEMHNENGQGNRQAKEGKSMCVIAKVDSPDEAIELCRQFVRNVFAIPSCCYYDPRQDSLTMYCGDAGSNWYFAVKSTESLCNRFGLKFFTV